MLNKNLEQQIEMILIKTINDADTQPVKLGDYLYIKGRIGWKGLKKSEYLPISDYRIINGESLTLSGIDWNKAGYISAERYELTVEQMSGLSATWRHVPAMQSSRCVRCSLRQRFGKRL